MLHHHVSNLCLLDFYALTTQMVISTVISCVFIIFFDIELKRLQQVRNTNVERILNGPSGQLVTGMHQSSTNALFS